MGRFEDKVHVVCMNDFPDCVCVPGTTEKEAKEIMAVRKERYAKANPGAQRPSWHLQTVPMVHHAEVIG